MAEGQATSQLSSQSAHPSTLSSSLAVWAAKVGGSPQHCLSQQLCTQQQTILGQGSTQSGERNMKEPISNNS